MGRTPNPVTKMDTRKKKSATDNSSPLPFSSDHKLASAITALQVEVKRIADGYVEVHDSIQCFSARWDEMERQLSLLSERLGSAVSECAENRKTIESLTYKISILEGSRKDIEAQNVTIDNMQYRLQERNIEIRGIPEDLNLVDEGILEKVSKVIDYDLKCEKIVQCYRPSAMASKKSVSPIIVEFQDLKTRNAFLHKVKEYHKGIRRNKLKSGLTTLDLGLSCRTDTSIYISDQLTKRGKFLLNEAKKMAKIKNYKFVWTAAGKIRLRKNEASQALTIFSQDDLKNLP
jgi:hypothetical protein